MRWLHQVQKLARLRLGVAPDELESMAEDLEISRAWFTPATPLVDHAGQKMMMKQSTSPVYKNPLKLGAGIKM